MGFSLSGALKGLAGPVAGIVTGNPAIGAAVTGMMAGGTADANNSAQMAFSRDQMKWQEHMSNTAHQREIADLKKAGLNPMLTGKYGGSSTPAGVGIPAIQNSAESASRVSTDSMNRSLISAQIERERSATDLNSAQAEKVRAETPGIRDSAYLTSVEADVARNLREYNFDDLVIAKRSSYQATGRKNLADALHDRLRYNDLERLRSIANRYGFDTVDSMIQSLDFDRLREEILQLRLGRSQLQASDQFYRGDWGKNIAPYLNGAESLSRLGLNAQRFGVGLTRGK